MVPLGNFMVRSAAFEPAPVAAARPDGLDRAEIIALTMGSDESSDERSPH